ncbi:hypothetical protein [Bacillus sp. FJAT-29937]|uniref:hypothetical protein n=1 Tax=Bacillus sp. FJAT-29937 TaxID=1720553 RepID=UPI00082D4604|nr:hypothetical protein [Bacillus sp. FJAT-29937]
MKKIFTNTFYERTYLVLGIGLTLLLFVVGYYYYNIYQDELKVFNEIIAEELQQEKIDVEEALEKRWANSLKIFVHLTATFMAYFSIVLSLFSFTLMYSQRKQDEKVRLIKEQEEAERYKKIEEKLDMLLKEQSSKQSKIYIHENSEELAKELNATIKVWEIINKKDKK